MIWQEIVACVYKSYSYLFSWLLRMYGFPPSLLILRSFMVIRKTFVGRPLAKIVTCPFYTLLKCLIFIYNFIFTEDNSLVEFTFFPRELECNHGSDGNRSNDIFTTVMSSGRCSCSKCLHISSSDSLLLTKNSISPHMSPVSYLENSDSTTVSEGGVPTILNDKDAAKVLIGWLRGAFLIAICLVCHSSFAAKPATRTSINIPPITKISPQNFTDFQHLKAFKLLNHALSAMTSMIIPINTINPPTQANNTNPKYDSVVVSIYAFIFIVILGTLICICILITECRNGVH